MKKRTLTKLGALLLSGAMMVSMAGCGNAGTGENGSGSVAGGTVGTQADGGAGEKSTEKLPTITMYPAGAHISSGIITGHKGEYFADNGFQLEVWAYSDEKTNAMLASGDLPDIIYVSKENLDTMIEAGMLLQLDDYLEEMPHLQSYEPMAEALNYVREFRSAGTGKVWCLPLSVGDSSAKMSWTDSTDRNAVKLRWDVYEEIGAPEIKDFDDLIDVMEQMVKARPMDEEGNPFYGTVLNSGTDTTYWGCMALWYRWHGYDENQLPYLLETDMVNGTYTSILDENSLYYQGLKWYNEVYRRGLMDPDSINNDRATQKAKVDGAMCMIPSGCLPGWAPNYYEYYIPDTNIYHSYEATYGDSNYVIAVNADTENLDACLKLLDMWCDTDAYFRIINGPDGEFWYSDGENAYLTEENLQYLRENGGNEQGRKYSTGEDAGLWNTSFCVNTGEFNSWKDGKGNYRVGRTPQWTEVMEINSQNENFANWKKTTGYDTWKDWLEAEKAYYPESPLDNVKNFCSQPDDSMQLTLDALKDVVVNASWKMVYAADDAEFEKIWTQMVADCEGLNVQQVQEWRLQDLENAKSVRDSLSK